MQVRNIASLFKLDPATVYLMEEIKSLVLFLLDNGKFKSNQIVADGTYEVHGNPIKPSDSSQRSAGSPFGAYTNPTYHSDLPPPHPPRSLKSNKIKNP